MSTLRIQSAFKRYPKQNRGRQRCLCRRQRGRVGGLCGSVTPGLCPERANLGEDARGVYAYVTVVKALGAHHLIHGRIGEHEFAVAQDAEHPIPSGRMTLGFHEDGAHFFHPETGDCVDANVKAHA